MGELDDPVVVEFPLRGEWVAAHTPAQKVPSHGTDGLGQRFAYDFLRTDSRGGMHFFRGSNLRYWTVGVPTSGCYCWQEPVHAPFDGEVVAARDGLGERARLHPVLDILTVVWNSLSANAGALVIGTKGMDLHPYLGNHVILKRGEVYAFFGHLYPNSVSVGLGQEVGEGELLGRVGHTGNSTAPHLHFHLMDSQDIMTAKGIPCAFRAYEAFRDGRWGPVHNGIPGYCERIRHVKQF